MTFGMKLGPDYARRDYQKGASTLSSPGISGRICSGRGLGSWSSPAAAEPSRGRVDEPGHAAGRQPELSQPPVVLREERPKRKNAAGRAQKGEALPRSSVAATATVSIRMYTHRRCGYEVPTAYTATEGGDECSGWRECQPVGRAPPPLGLSSSSYSLGAPPRQR